MRYDPPNWQTAELVLCGQAPVTDFLAQGRDPAPYALFPYPEGCAGHRLFKMTGLSRSEYLKIRRTNLFDVPVPYLFREDWRTQGARKAEELAGCNVLFMGSATARAFFRPPIPILSWQDGFLFNWAVLPHPSGRNRWYNEYENAEAAVEFVATAVAREVDRRALPSKKRGYHRS